MHHPMTSAPFLHCLVPFCLLHPWLIHCEQCCCAIESNKSRVYGSIETGVREFCLMPRSDASRSRSRSDASRSLRSLDIRVTALGQHIADLDSRADAFDLTVTSMSDFFQRRMHVLEEAFERRVRILELQVHTLRLQTAALGAPVPPAGPPPATPLVPRPRPHGSVGSEEPWATAAPRVDRPATSRVDSCDL